MAIVTNSGYEYINRIVAHIKGEYEENQMLERREREALDRHITGNYGEEQFRGCDGADQAEHDACDGIDCRCTCHTEVDPACERCGMAASDHKPFLVSEELYGTYEDIICPICIHQEDDDRGILHWSEDTYGNEYRVDCGCRCQDCIAY